MAEPLEVGDAVATDLLSALAPLRVEEAHDELERRASYRLRYAAVVERGLASDAMQSAPTSATRTASVTDRPRRVRTWDFMLDGTWYRIGSAGTRLTLAGTGLGTRTVADPPRAQLDVAIQVHHA